MSAFSSANVNSSISLDYSLYDGNNTEFTINSGDNKTFDIWISRNSKFTEPTYTELNGTEIKSTPRSQIFTTGFQTKGAFISIHVNLKPSNLSSAYLTLLKFNSYPVLNDSIKDYDYFKVVCPQDSITDSLNNSFYLLFLNMNQTYAYSSSSQKFIGLGIRELNDAENQSLCANEARQNLTRAPIAPQYDFLFKYNLSILAYSSGCYYLNKTSVSWSSEGVEVLDDTNTTHTHCISSHLTEFAGGFVVLPNQINFDYVWANADFMRNPTVYATVIAITGLFLVLLVWCRWMDLVDLKKTQIYFLNDNQKYDTYLYEVILFTGNRRNAGTDSKVFMSVSGSLSESNDRYLKSDSKSYAFKRGGIDTFIMSVKK